ncbi:MAG: diaminopimelate epimerase [Dethiobacteria bacterium]
MEFVKMHGLGNDFIIVNNLQSQWEPAYLQGLASRLCQRNFGIGADGLVLLNTSRVTAFEMRIFNADGSEAEMCGNAIRCLAKYVWERGLTGEQTFSFETLGGVKQVGLLLQGQAVKAVKVAMGKPLFSSAEIPLAGPPRHAENEKICVGNTELTFTGVNMGNPHCVIFVPSLQGIPWQGWGAKLETDPLFPQRTNVEFVKTINPQKIEMKVWERGAGPTLACGTGACAAAAAGILTGRLANEVEVHLPGGILKISWKQGEEVYMQGPATEVFSGRISLQDF